jgi:hypothetical protein
MRIRSGQSTKIAPSPLPARLVTKNDIGGGGAPGDLPADRRPVATAGACPAGGAVIAEQTPGFPQSRPPARRP